jgi:hypothetical protein
MPALSSDHSSLGDLRQCFDPENDKSFINYIGLYRLQSKTQDLSKLEKQALFDLYRYIKNKDDIRKLQQYSRNDAQHTEASNYGNSQNKDNLESLEAFKLIWGDLSKLQGNDSHLYYKNSERSVKIKLPENRKYYTHMRLLDGSHWVLQTANDNIWDPYLNGQRLPDAQSCGYRCLGEYFSTLPDNPWPEIKNLYSSQQQADVRKEGSLKYFNQFVEAKDERLAALALQQKAEVHSDSEEEVRASSVDTVDFSDSGSSTPDIKRDRDSTPNFNPELQMNLLWKFLSNSSIDYSSGQDIVAQLKANYDFFIEFRKVASQADRPGSPGSDAGSLPEMRTYLSNISEVKSPAPKTQVDTSRASGITDSTVDIGRENSAFVKQAASRAGNDFKFSKELVGKFQISNNTDKGKVLDLLKTTLESKSESHHGPDGIIDLETLRSNFQNFKKSRTGYFGLNKKTDNLNGFLETFLNELPKDNSQIEFSVELRSLFGALNKKSLIDNLNKSSSKYKGYVKQLLGALLTKKISEVFFKAELDSVLGDENLKKFIQGIKGSTSREGLLKKFASSDSAMKEWSEVYKETLLPSEDFAEDKRLAIVDYAKGKLAAVKEKTKQVGKWDSVIGVLDKFSGKQVNIHETILCLQRHTLSAKGSWSLGGNLYRVTGALVQDLLKCSSIETKAEKKQRREASQAVLNQELHEVFSNTDPDPLSVEKIKQQGQLRTDVLSAIGCANKENVEFVIPLIDRLEETKSGIESHQSAFSPEKKSSNEVGPKFAAFKACVGEGDFVRVGRLLTKIEKCHKKYAALAGDVQDLEKAYVKFLIHVCEEASNYIKSIHYYQAKKSCFGLFSELDSARYEIDLGGRAQDLVEHFDLSADNIAMSFKRYGRYLGPVDSSLIALCREMRTTGYVERFKKAFPEYKKGKRFGYFLWETDLVVDEKNKVRELIQETIKKEITQANKSREDAVSVEGSASPEAKSVDGVQENSLPKGLFQVVKQTVQKEVGNPGNKPCPLLSDALDSYHKFHASDETQVLEAYIVWQRFCSIANEDLKNKLDPKQHAKALYQLIRYLKNSSCKPSHDDIETIFREVSKILGANSLDDLDAVKDLVYKVGFDNAKVILSAKAEASDAKHIRIEGSNISYAMPDGAYVQPLESFEINRPDNKFLSDGENIFQKDSQGKLSKLDQAELQRYQNQARLEMYKHTVAKKRFERSDLWLVKPDYDAFLNATLSSNAKKQHELAKINLDRVCKAEWTNAKLVSFAEESLSELGGLPSSSAEKVLALSFLSFEKQIEAAELARCESRRGHSSSALSLDNHLYTNIKDVAKGSNSPLAKIAASAIGKVVESLRSYDKVLASRWKRTAAKNVHIKYDIMQRLMRLARHESDQEVAKILADFSSIHESVSSLGENSQLKERVLGALGELNNLMMKRDHLKSFENSFDELNKALEECGCGTLGKRKAILLELKKLQVTVVAQFNDHQQSDLPEKIATLVQALEKTIGADKMAKKDDEGLTKLPCNPRRIFAGKIDKNRTKAEAEILLENMAAIGF